MPSSGNLPTPLSLSDWCDSTGTGDGVSLKPIPPLPPSVGAGRRGWRSTPASRVTGPGCVTGPAIGWFWVAKYSRAAYCGEPVTSRIELTGKHGKCRGMKMS